MGKASRWLCSLLGFKKSEPEADHNRKNKKKEKKKRTRSKWGFVESTHAGAEKSVKVLQFKNAGAGDPLASPYFESGDASKHAIAVAAATVAVAEAALAAAHAAAEVVRLAGGGARGTDVDARHAVAAAVKIQSSFRAYLARRALRALKGLVKLQALVRGRIVRKKTTHMLRQMQAMARIQARASANRVTYVYMPQSPNSEVMNRIYNNNNSKKENQTRSARSKQTGSPLKQCGSRSSRSNSVWLDRWMQQSKWNNQKLIISSPKVAPLDEDQIRDKILEIDTVTSNPPARRTSCSSAIMSPDYYRKYLSDTTNTAHSTQCYRGLPASPVYYVPEFNDRSCNSPAVDYATLFSGRHSSTSTCNRRGSFTPTRSEAGDFFGHPNYMANTESSLAKVRSQSAPKQRMANGEELRAVQVIGESDNTICC